MDTGGSFSGGVIAMLILKRRKIMIKRNIRILWGIALLQGMVFYAPVATLYRQAAGLGIFHITLIESISLWLIICLEIPWGWAADRIGYRKTMLCCCGIYFISKIVFWQAEGFCGFLLERILLSIVCAGISGVDSTMLYLSCGEGKSHWAFSIYESLGQAGLLLSAGIYALWVGDNYRLAAFLTVLSYGTAAILSLGLREISVEAGREPGKSPASIWTVLKRQLSNPSLVMLLLAVGLFNESHQTITVYLSQLQYVRAGMNPAQISLAYILVNVLALMGGLSARLSNRLGSKAMGIGLLVLASISCLVMGLFPFPTLSVLSVMMLRACFGLMQPLQMELQNRTFTGKERATALSVNAVILDGMGIFLNLLYGAVAQTRLDFALYLGAALCAVGAVFYRKAVRAF